ncbi:hypothetical protein ES705_15390 [subsurface metagenome]
MPGMAAADRFISCWLFNENGGSKVFEPSGRRHTGILQPGTSWTSGKSGSAIELDGVTGHIEIADHDIFTPVGTPFSIKALIYMHTAAKFSIASKGSYNIDGEWKFGFLTDKKLMMQRFDESVPSCYISARCDTPLAAYENQWIDATMTSDGSAVGTGMKIYLNAARIDDTYYCPGAFVEIEKQGHDVWIGRSNDLYANGLFDHVMFFNWELLASEVARLYREPFYMFPEPVRPEIIIAA